MRKLNILLLSILVASVTGCGSKTEKTKNEPPAFDVVTTPDEITNLYAQNTVSADMKFKGKRIKISGIIEEISTDFSGDPYIIFKTSDRIGFNNPHCEFNKKNLNEIAQFQKGRFISIICTGKGDVVKTPMLDDCIIDKNPQNTNQVNSQPVHQPNENNQMESGNAVQQPSTLNTGVPAQATSASSTSNDWVHVNSRQGNYGNTNHAYVLPSSLNNNKIQVKEVIEGGQRNGSHYTYWMEASCSDGMIRMASNVQQFGANNRFIGENPPSSPGWYRATGQKDPAVWNYICRR